MTTSINRFQLLSVEQLMFPHKCSICGSFTGKVNSTRERKFVHIGLDIEFFGAVYICTECVPSLISVVDFIPVEEFNKIEAINKELQIVITQLSDENRGLRIGMDSLRGLGTTAITSAAISIPAKQTKGSTNKKLTGGEEKPSGQTNERGLKDLLINESDPFTDVGLGI